MKKLFLILLLNGCATVNNTPTNIVQPDIIKCVSSLDNSEFSFHENQKKEIYLDWADIYIYQIIDINGTKIQMNQFEIQNYNCQKENK